MAASIALVLSPGTQNIAGNYTPVNWYLYYYGNGASYSAYENRNPWTVSFGGQAAGISAKSGYATFTKSTSAQLLASGTINVPHKDDGTAAITASATFDAPNTSAVRNLKASASATLSQIPRVTDMSLSVSSAYMGDGITIYTPRKSSNFTHNLYYNINDGSWVYIGGGVTTSYYWTIAKALVNSMSGTSCKIGILCQTYNGATHLGNDTAYMTVYVPRTQPSMSASSKALGEAIAINTPRGGGTDIRHILYYQIGSAAAVEIARGVEDSYAWTIPKSIADSFPNAVSGTVKILCNTYNGSSYAGTTYAGQLTTSFTATIPDTDEFKPTIDEVTITEAVAKVTEAFAGMWVQNLSQVNVAIEASGAYSSSIKNYSTSIEGVNYISAAFTSNALHSVGEIYAEVKVTDSRGRTTTESIQLIVVEYQKPTVDVSFARCDPDGTLNSGGSCMLVTITGKVSPVENENSKTLTLQWKKASESGYQTKGVTITDWEFSVNEIVTDITSDETWVFGAILTDKIDSATDEDQTGQIAMSFLAGGKGVALFGEANKEGLEIFDAENLIINGIDWKITEEQMQELYDLLGISGGGE